MTEHKAFKELIKKYRSITRANIALMVDEGFPWNVIKEELTGFGDKNSCVLCQDAKSYYYFNDEFCKNCGWMELTGEKCTSIYKSYETYIKIERAQTIEDLYQAYQDRADYMEKVLKGNEKPDIKPCPFCGSEIDVKRNKNREWDINKVYNLILHEEQIVCKNCGARSPSAETKEEAIEKWNLAKRREQK